MARQNNMLPKGAGPHLRSPHASHDPSEPAQGYGSAYPPQYDSHEHDDQPSLPGGAPRDIFSALRPDPPSLASRFEPFSPPGGRPHQQGGYGQPQFGEPDTQPYAAPGHDPYGRPLPGGYPAHGGYGGEAGSEHDQHYYGQQPQHGYAPQGQYGQHGHEDAYAYDDPYRPGAADPYAASAEMAPGHGADGGYYDDEYAEEAESKTRRGPRAVVVIGALLGAIALGGGLAYGYKAMTNGGGDGGKLPLLRADSAPAKAQPTEPGGKQMAHTDKKFLNRLTEDRGPARPVPVSILPPPPERETGEGPRRVPTLVVNRDGTIGSSSAEPSAPPAAASGVPGLLVDGLTPRMPPPREAAPPPQARAMPIEEPAPAAPPRRVASAPAATAIEPPPAATPAPPPPRQAAPEPRRPPPVRQAARTPPPAPAAPAATTSGYVAVLSSRRSHMDALKSFADIQQKHPSVLQGRAPDVREANLGEKGLWYRLVVGPPGSRDAANSVCGQLKSQGYVGCWIMAY